MQNVSLTHSWQAAVSPKAAAPRRLLSPAEMLDTLTSAVGVRESLHIDGASWGDVQLFVLDCRERGEARIPPTAFYALASFAGHAPTLSTYGNGAGRREVAGSMFVSGAGRGFEYRWAAGHRATWICFEPAIVAAAAADCGIGSEPPEIHGRVAPRDRVCEHLLAALAEEAQLPAYALQGLLVEQLASALACRLVMQFAADELHALSLPGALNMRAFREVRAYIEEHLDERVTLDDLARVAGVSRFHFARQFRLRTGESPMGFLLRARVERAKRLLRETSAAIGDIAAMLGFADQSHFTRTFKRLVGMPPSAYGRGGPRTRAHAAQRRSLIQPLTSSRTASLPTSFKRS